MQRGLPSTRSWCWHPVQQMRTCGRTVWRRTLGSCTRRLTLAARRDAPLLSSCWTTPAPRSMRAVGSAMPCRVAFWLCGTREPPRTPCCARTACEGTERERTWSPSTSVRCSTSPTKWQRAIVNGAALRAPGVGKTACRRTACGRTVLCSTSITRLVQSSAPSAASTADAATLSQCTCATAMGRVRAVVSGLCCSLTRPNTTLTERPNQSPTRAPRWLKASAPLPDTTLDQ